MSSKGVVLKGAVAVPEKSLQLDFAAAAGTASPKPTTITIPLDRLRLMHLPDEASSRHVMIPRKHRT